MHFLRKHEELLLARAVPPMKKNGEISNDFNYLTSKEPPSELSPCKMCFISSIEE
jgi:hypothetical protein